MALSAFDDKSKQPQDADLKIMLGGTYSLWHDLKDRIISRFAPLTEEWGFTSKTTGWGFRLKQEKRVLIYMTPCGGYFLASFVLGERAVKAAHDAKLPATVLKVIDEARKYAEGRGVRLEVRTARDVSNVEMVAAIKAAN